MGEISGKPKLIGSRERYESIHYHDELSHVVAPNTVKRMNKKKHPKRSAPREIKNTTKKKSRIRDNLESGLSRSGEKRWSREEIQRRPVVAPSLLQFRQ
jgi:hypothetical protein